jgi:hypothetical protein
MNNNKRVPIIKERWLLPLYFIVIFTIFGCGGGGGYSLKKKIVVNDARLKKQSVEIINNEVQVKKKLLYKNGNKRFHFYANINNKEYVNPYYFTWDDHQYIIACWLGGSQWSGGVGLFDADKNLLSFIKTPRYCTGAIAMPVTINKKDDLLAIFILQQTTSRSSTLLLLDHEWNITYKEYLGKGKWFGKLHKNDKGFILVDELPDRKNENIWFYYYE